MRWHVRTYFEAAPRDGVELHATTALLDPLSYASQAVPRLQVRTADPVVSRVQRDPVSVLSELDPQVPCPGVARCVRQDLLYAAEPGVGVRGVVEIKRFGHLEMHARYLAGCRQRKQDRRKIDSARLAKLADHVPNIAQQQLGDRMGFADMVSRAAVHTT